MPAVSETLPAVLSGEDARPALVSADDDQVLTFGRLHAEVEALAGKLRTIGVRRGDRVALVLPNGPELVQLLLAIASLGAAAAPLNPAYTKDEFSFYLDDLDPCLVLVPAGDLAAVRTAATAPLQIVDVLAERGEPVALRVGDGVVRTPTPFEPAVPEDIALLLHTSGTTSRPKQVPLLHRNLVASARSMAAHYRLTEEDVSYCAMPLFHVHGLVASTLAALLAGGAVVVPRRLAPRAFWAQLERHGVTWLSAGPTLHHMLLERGGEGVGPGRASLRFVRSCSSALSLTLFHRAEERYGVPMLEAYGMTEASHEMSANPLPPKRRVPGTVGIPTGAEICIADARGASVAPGTPGEVTIRGPGVTPGYLANPEANAEAFRDGWFRTGDQGVLEDGYLRLVGRLKEMILRGGENISPLEIEEVLLGHPAVVDAVCFGVPDEKYGEEVSAAVALRGEAGERELLDHCRERLAAFKVPKVIHVVEAIPRTPTGKLQRRRVAALISGR